MTDKQLAAAQRRSLAAIRRKLLDMSAEWDGRDQFNVSQLERLADDAKELSAGLIDADSRVD